MLQLMLAVVTLHLFFRALETSSRAYAIAMAAVSGLVAADSPLGFIPVFAFSIVVIKRIGFAVDPLLVPFANPLVRLVTFRRMTIAFLFTWLMGVLSNAMFFKLHGGLVAHEWNSFTYLIHYLHNYAQLVSGSVTAVGALFVIGVVVVPQAVTSFRLLPVLLKPSVKLFRL